MKKRFQSKTFHLLAELIGNAVQVTGNNVKELLVRAKGKVLFIDGKKGV
jgi:hypothetical protein